MRKPVVTRDPAVSPSSPLHRPSDSVRQSEHPLVDRLRMIANLLSPQSGGATALEAVLALNAVADRFIALAPACDRSVRGHGPTRLALVSTSQQPREGAP